MTKFPFLLLILLAASVPPPAARAQKAAPEQVRTEIPYRDGKVVLTSDFQERVSPTRYRAVGHVLITYQDMVITGDEAEYDEETRQGFAAGQTKFSQNQQWLTCSRAEFDFTDRTAVFHDASGYTDRQFSIVGRTILKTGPDTYRIESGIVTSCRQKRPEWGFGASRTEIHVDKTARMYQTVFRIKGFPVFYAPVMVLPMEKKSRSSGFVPFHTANSTTKGRVVSEGYYQTLGPSADALLYADYFSLRGVAVGGIFRARPNPQTHFYLQVYGIHDTLNQGGVQVVMDGQTQFKEDWRAVARVNLFSSFTFQQAFADTFRAATVAQEQATVFLTRNHDSFSTNIAAEQQEVLFPSRNLAIKHLPSLELLSLGTPLGSSPFVLDFRASFDGVGRSDSFLSEPLSARLDFHPEITVRIPSFKGFSIVPSFGLRETYYSARLDPFSPTGASGDGLNRRYADLTLDFKTPVLEKEYDSKLLGKFDHVIEPFATYRWIHGIDNFGQVLRFDEVDAIADTSEVEYGLFNRFYSRRQNAAGSTERQEVLSVGLLQKYYFDPTFGGAFVPGQLNAFYPLDTLSGFYQTGIVRNLSPLSAVAQYTPRGGFNYDVRVDYDTKLQHFRNESFASTWHQGKFQISGSYVRVHTVETGMIPSNQIQAQVGYGSPARGLSSSLTISYNLLTSQLLNSQTRLNYVWDCCGISIEYMNFDLGLRTESRFTFSFTLKGLGSFGNLKRPESLF